MIKVQLNEEEPRVFQLKGYQIKDLGSIHFYVDEQKTNEFFSLETKEGRKCDIAATSWGYYLGPSLNSRLVREGFCAALVLNAQNQVYLMAVEDGKSEEFAAYLSDSDARVLTWINDEFLGEIFRLQEQAKDFIK